MEIFMLLGGIMIFAFSLAGTTIVLVNSEGLWGVIPAIGLLGSFWMFAKGIEMTRMGRPKKLIKNGCYRMVGCVEIPDYYQMILKNDNGEVEFYSLPKDMIIVRKSYTDYGTLEIEEQAGLRKAIFYKPS